LHKPCTVKMGFTAAFLPHLAAAGRVAAPWPAVCSGVKLPVYSPVSGASLLVALLPATLPVSVAALLRQRSAWCEPPRKPRIAPGSKRMLAESSSLPPIQEPKSGALYLGRNAPPTPKYPYEPLSP